VEYREVSAPIWTTVNANNTTKTITNLQPDTDYEVKIRSKCSGNQYSAYTDILKFRTQKCYKPRSPRLVDTDVNSARIEWNTSVNATRYQLDYKTGSNPWTTITTTDTFRVLNNLLQNETYEVRLRSQCATGVYSDYPDTIYVVVSPCVPPSNFQLDQVSFTNATFHWDTTDYATRYRLEYKRQNDTFWQSQLVNGTTTTLNGLDHGTVYQAQISSRCGNNLFSPVGRVIRFRTEICEIPYNVIIDSVGYSTIDMRWLDVNAPHYEVHYKLLSDVNWTIRQANNSSVRLNQLISGASYEIKVRARCVPNAFSGFSPPIIIKTNLCRTPFNLRVDTIPPNRLRFSWSPLNGRNNGYEVSYRLENDNTYTTRNTQDTFIVVNVNYNQRWQFRVRTRCGNGLFSDYAVYLNPQTEVGCNGSGAVITTIRCGQPRIILQGGGPGSGEGNPYFWNGGIWSLTSCSTGQVVATQQVTGIIQLPYTLPNGPVDQAAFFDNRTGPHIICFSGNNTGGRPNCVVCDTICLIPFHDNNPNIPPPVTITSQSLGCTLGYDLTVNDLCLGNECIGNNLPFIQWTVNGTVIGSTRSIRVNPTVRTTYQVSVNQYGCPSTATITLDPSNNGLPIEKQCDGDICFGATYRAVFSYLGQSGETDINFSLNGLPYSDYEYEGQSAGTETDHRFSIRLRPNTSNRPGYVVGRNVIRFGRFDLDFTCYGEDSCVFFVYPALSATITATPGITIPQGGNVTLSTTVTGGQPPYTYSWSPINYASGTINPYNGSSAVINNLTARTEFCVHITDAIGCVTDVCQVINIEECPSACCSLVVEDRNDICRRNQFRLCVRGGDSPYDTYDWEFPWLENITPTTTPCIDINIPPNFIGSNRQISVIAIRDGEPTSCRTAIQIREIGHNEFPGSKVCTLATSQQLLTALNIPFGPNDPFPTVTPAVWGVGTIVFANDFQVNTRIRFRNMNMEVAPSREILVPRRGHIWLDKCTVYGQNGQEWLGISTLGNSSSLNQPIVELDSTLLQHARIGIDASGTPIDRRRSLVRVDSSCLNENRIHIRMFHNPSRWIDPPFSNFAATPLLMRADSLICINPLPGTTNDYTDVGVWVRDVNSVQIGSDGLPQWAFVFNRFNRADVGIRTQGSNSYINGNTIGDLIPNPLTTPNTPLPTGIEIIPFTDGAASGGPGTVIVGTNYANIIGIAAPNTMERGIYVTGTGANVDIISNIILNLHNTTGIQGRPATGVWLKDLNNSTIRIEENFFLGTELGIMSERTIAGNPLTDIIVDHNFFEGYQNGFYSRNGGDALYSTTISNNQFRDRLFRQNGIIGPAAWDAAINMWGLNNPQSVDNRTRILDNRLTGTGNIGIAILRSHRTPIDMPLIQGNIIGNTSGTGRYQFGINASLSDGVRIIDNTIRCIPTGIPAPNDPDFLQAIQLYNAFDNEIRCNRLGNAKQGIMAILPCGPGGAGTGTHVAYNLFRNNQNGIQLNSNGFIGNQGGGSFVRLNDPNVANSNYNFWSGCMNAVNVVQTDGSQQTITTTFNSNGCTWSSDPVLCLMPSSGVLPVNLVSAPNYNQLLQFNSAGCDLSAADFFTFTSATTPSDASVATAEQVVKGLKTVGGREAEYNYMARYHLLEGLSASGNTLTEQSTLLDSFFNANRTGNMAQFITVDRLIARNRAQAKIINAQIAPANLIEANMKVFNTLYINWLDQHSFTESNLADLAQIADQCLVTGGKAVGQARNLRAVWEGFARYHDDNCWEAVTTPKAKKQRIVAMTTNRISVYPNPAQASVQVQYDLTEEATGLSVRNAIGVEVSRRNLNGKKGNLEMDTRNLPAGIMYVIQIKGTDQTVLSTQKLMIVK
jgi:hypothetical protein